MDAYLQLLADGSIDLTPVSSATYPIEDAASAYASLKVPGERPLLVLLEYGKKTAAAPKLTLRTAPAQPGKINIGLAGAGGFARGMHLPNLVKLQDRFTIRGIMSRTGSTARAVALQHQAAYATTDYGEMLKDPEIQLVIICTRHNLHAPMVIEALKAGKHVLVEKPLAINREGLLQIKQFFAEKKNPPTLMTGFNRRFSPALRHIKSLLATRASPLIVDYRMNAGFIPQEHWVHGEEGGGRNIGEACHIYDLFNFLTDSNFSGVHAQSIRAKSKQWQSQDNFVATVSYEDGSVCTLTYTSLGAKDYPKERMEVFVGGTVLSMDNFTDVTVAGSRQKGCAVRTMDKGQFHELEVLADCLQKGKAWPISLEQQIAATEISFLVEDQL